MPHSILVLFEKYLGLSKLFGTAIPMVYSNLVQIDPKRELT